MKNEGLKLTDALGVAFHDKFMDRLTFKTAFSTALPD